MRKSASEIFKLLPVKKLNLFLSLPVLILVVSLVILLLALKPAIENSAGIARSLNIQCQSDVSNRCFRNFFASYAKEHSFEESKAVLSELQKINSSTRYCHGIAHTISIAEVGKNPGNWLEAFNYVPETECSVGFFHGVIEGKYRTDPDFRVTSTLINEVCLENPMALKSAQSSGRCTHAFGHVLLVQDQGDISKSLATCRTLFSKITAHCYQGVFMENIQRENLSEHGIADREIWNQDYLELQKDYCNDFSKELQNECWRSLEPVILAVVNSLNQGIAFCQTAPEYNSKRFCTREITGQGMVNELANGEEGGSLTDSCLAFADTGQYTNCVTDLVEYTLLTAASYKPKILEFCKITRDEAKFRCLDQVKNY